jgi:membrane protein YdbS with pleckstrin-like domain
MTLRGFHVVFIVFSMLLALGIGSWCVWVDLVAGEPVYRAGAIWSFAAALALFVYGIWFYRKMKKSRLIT